MKTKEGLQNDFGIRLVPVQWRTMLENGIEIDVQNNNLFDLSVLDLCKGRGGNDPKSVNSPKFCVLNLQNILRKKLFPQLIW